MGIPEATDGVPASPREVVPFEVHEVVGFVRTGIGNTGGKTGFAEA